MKIREKICRGIPPRSILTNFEGNPTIFRHLKIGGTESVTDIQTYRQTYRHTDIFFIVDLESWDAKMDAKKFLARSEKKTDGIHYSIIRSEGSSDI